MQSILWEHYRESASYHRTCVRQKGSQTLHGMPYTPLAPPLTHHRPVVSPSRPAARKSDREEKRPHAPHAQKGPEPLAPRVPRGAGATDGEGGGTEERKALVAD